MADADLGPGLTGTAAGPTGAITAAVVDRDRRWVRRVTWLTAGLWVVTLATVGLLLRTYELSMRPYMRRQMELYHEAEKGGEAGAHADRALSRRLTVYTNVLTHGTALLAAAVGVLALASVSTLVLIHLTRRATLRQINLSLQAISEQLRQIQSAQAKPPPS
jgi:hypothetical protein